MFNNSNTTSEIQIDELSPISNNIDKKTTKQQHVDRNVYAKKLTDDLFISVKLTAPYHNVRMNTMEVRLSSGISSGIGDQNSIDKTKFSIIERYTCACLCEPNQVTNQRESIDKTTVVGDQFIDPSNHSGSAGISIQTFLQMKELSQHEKTLFIRLDGFGNHPGRTKLKFLALVFEIYHQEQVYHVYLTLKILKNLVGKQMRGYTSIDSCFFSNLIQGGLEKDDFLQSIINAKCGEDFSHKSSSSSTKTKPPTRKIAKRRSVCSVLDDKFQSFFNEAADVVVNSSSSSTAASAVEGEKSFIQMPSYEVSNNQSENVESKLFDNVKMSKIQFDVGPIYGGQANSIYLSYDKVSNDVFDNEFEMLLRNHVQSLDIRFIPQEDSSTIIGIPQILHMMPIHSSVDGEHDKWSINFITPSVIDCNSSIVPSSVVKTWVFIILNEQVLDGNIEYTFYCGNDTHRDESITCVIDDSFVLDEQQHRFLTTTTQEEMFKLEELVVVEEMYCFNEHPVGFCSFEKQIVKQFEMKLKLNHDEKDQKTTRRRLT